MDLFAFAVPIYTKFLPFLYALVGFGLLITIHECGHFLFCKLFGIHTPTFSIGMGPTIFQRKVGDTNFRLALIPIGGYVEIEGIAEVGQGDQAHADSLGPRSFSTKPYWQRFLVLIGGILFNLIFAYFVFAGLYLTGMPVQKEVDLVIRKVGEISKNNKVDLRVGDKILSINKHKLYSDPKRLFESLKVVSEELSGKDRKDAEVRVKRGKRKVSVRIPKEVNGSNLQRGILGGSTLGLNIIRVEYERYSIFQSIKMGMIKTHELIGRVFSGLKMLVTQRSIKGFGGPIMIVTQSFKMAKRGFRMLFNFLALISINLAVINLLPIGALDGGQLVFETVEAILRRKIPNVIRFSVNIVSWFFILGLILLLSYQDIISLFFG